MSEAKKLECFVIMPFGKKELFDGHSCNFETIYGSIIAPAVHAAGMIPLRADDGSSSNIIHSEMFRKLRDKPIVLADLSTANPNVFYELGVRHVMSSRGTVLICRSGLGIPFDVALLRVIEYSVKGASPTAKEIEAAARTITAALRAAVGQFNSPVYQFLPRVTRQYEAEHNADNARRAESDPLVKYPRIMAAIWRQTADDIANLLREHAGTAFGVRTLGYFCLDGGTEPATSLKIAWELSRAQEYDLATELYDQLKASGHVVGNELLKMAATYHDKDGNEEAIAKAMSFVQEVLDDPHKKGPSSDDPVPPADEITALGYSRRGSLLQHLWELTEDDNNLDLAIAAYAAARDEMEKARRIGNFPYPGMLAHTLLKLLVLNRLRSLDTGDPGRNCEAILRIRETNKDHKVSVSYLHWAQVIAHAYRGEERLVDEKIAKRLVADAMLTGSAGSLEIGGRQYSTLLRFLDRYEEALGNPSIIEKIARALSVPIRAV